MGVAAYNRGSKAISEQIDREQAERRAPVSFDTFEKVEAENARLRTENELLTGKLNEASVTLREVKTGLAELQKLVEASGRQQRHLLGLWRAARHREQVFAQRWRWVSAIVRACVSPATVREFRDDEKYLADIEKSNRKVG